MNKLDRRMERRELWLGKFAFPKVNTKKTSLIYTDKWEFYIRNSRGEIEQVQLQRWGYKSKRRQLEVTFGYHEESDTLIVKQTSIREEDHRPHPYAVHRRTI
jgi:hypothetical protein